MAVTSCVITDTLPADSTPKSFTRSGFGTPDAAIVITGRGNTVNNPQPELDISIGFWDGTNQYAVSSHAVDNVGTSQTSRFRYSNRIGGMRYHNGTSYVNIAQWTIANVTDGVQFTLTDDNTSAGHYATVILFKGVTNKKVGTFQFGGSTLTVDVADVGFKPSIVFMADPVSATAYSTALAEATDAHLNFGVAHNNSANVVTQAGVTYFSSTSVSQALVNFSIHDKILRRWYADNAGLSFTTSISDFDASGFSVTLTGTSTSRPLYLALELPDPDAAYVGIIDSKTSTGTQAHTGVGFEPLALLLASTTETALNQSSTTPNGALMFGAADGTAQQSIIVMDEDNASSKNTASRADTSNILNLRFHDDTVDAVAALSSFDSDGFTLNYSDGSAAARKILAFAIGAGGGATITADGLTQGHSLGSPALTQANVLAVQAVAQSQSLDAPALTQHNVLAVNAIAQAHALGNVTLTQAHILTVQGIGQAHSLGAPSLTQHNALTPDALTQAQTLGNITLTIAGSIAAADIAQGHSLGTPALTQHNVLAVAALMQAHSLDQPALSHAGTLAVQNMTQAQVLDAVALVQHHALAVQALLQGHALGNITLTASDALAIDGLTHAQILGAPSLTQHNVLAVQNMTHAQILQAVTLGGLVIGSLRGTLVAYSLLDGEVVCRALLSGSPTTVH